MDREGRFVWFPSRALKIQCDDEWAKDFQTPLILSPSLPLLRRKKWKKMAVMVKGLVGLMGLRYTFLCPHKPFYVSKRHPSLPTHLLTPYPLKNFLFPHLEHRNTEKGTRTSKHGSNITVGVDSMQRISQDNASLPI